ncbi:adenylate/guanylate cyclase domain-containing protein [Alkalimarinus alittae]|uniref:Adenylate/guanylate cyclase domain-containing protein n=1 Tax=Alkalimarinus alittae TaxID=2961619 RepID=A0ABY6N6C4_9ALTE|nr:adenylate/guanylate cyclase domain-containing protein [Alkalimarinus alittae]UZE97678.1 adenylate/guanylate cyclase domain-containing protein [Alkalimarinus alittae]
MTITNKTTRQIKPVKQVAIPPMPDYNARVLAYLAGVAIIVAGILSDHFDPNLIWIIPGSLLWPHLLYFVVRYFNRQRNPIVRQRLLLLDAFLTGPIVVLIDFSLVPTLLFILMLNFSFIIVGGMKSWLYGNLAWFVSICLTSMFFGISIAPPTPISVSIISGLSVGIYICVTAYYTHQQARTLVHAKSLIQHQREQSITLSHKLAKYLSPQVWQSIFTGERDVRLETQRKKLAVFFSDIKGFTELSEEMEPESLTELLNTYFNAMSQIALKYGGTIDKFVGDSIMIFFGDPTSRGAKEDTLACVAMGIDMRKRMKILRQKWQSQGIRTPLEIRMGISTGYCTVGNFGAENRMDYTIIGKEVNLASRLESLAEPGEILVSYETFSLVKDMVMCRDKGEITVKGFSRSVPIYEVVDFRREIGANQSFMEHETTGFAMYLDTGKIGVSEKEQIVRALESAAQKLKDSEDIE